MSGPRRQLALLLGLVLGGAGCDFQYVKVVVLGDSHSDVHWQPRYDWLAWTPPTWEVDSRAVSGQRCWEAIPPLVADPGSLEASTTLVIFCGGNDASDPAWDLATTAGWIATAIGFAQERGKAVVVVTPPPVFGDVPLEAAAWNGRLELLCAALLALESEHGIDVADVWTEVWRHPDPASLYVPDGLHMTPEGRLLMSQVIQASVHRARYQLEVQDLWDPPG